MVNMRYTVLPPTDDQFGVIKTIQADTLLDQQWPWGCHWHGLFPCDDRSQ